MTVVNNSSTGDKKIELVQNTIKGGYLSGRVYTQLIDHAMQHQLIAFRNGAFLMGTFKKPLTFKKHAIYMPFWIRRVVHHARLQVSSDYHKNFEESIARVAKASISAGLPLEKWVAKEEAKLKKRPNRFIEKRLEERHSIGQEDESFYEIILKLLEHEDMNAVSLFCKLFLKKEIKEIYPDLVKQLLSKKKLTEGAIKQAVEIALKFQCSWEINIRDLELVHAKNPCYEMFKKAFWKLIKEDQIESAMLIAQPFFSQHKKDAIYPRLVRHLVKKQNLRMAIELTSDLSEGTSKSSCIQLILNRAQPWEVSKLRAELGIPEDLNYQIAQKVAEDRNIKGTLLMISLLNYDLEKAMVLATLIDSILNKELPEEDDQELVVDIVQQVADHQVLTKTACLLASKGNFQATTFLMEKLDFLTGKEKLKICHSLIDVYLAKPKLSRLETKRLKAMVNAHVHSKTKMDSKITNQTIN